MQRGSARELAARRASVVQAVRAVAPLRFVNGGGTGSVEATASEARSPRSPRARGCSRRRCSTPTARFTPRPAALFALPVVRRPSARVATVLGGGYPASGPAGRDRLPRPVARGLRLDRQEGAGEVQTPLRGPAAAGLRIGDRVWMRHAKAGELCERFDVLHLVRGRAPGRHGAYVPRRGPSVPSDPRVLEPAVRVELGAHGLEGVPLRVAGRELVRVQERALAPVRAAAERAHQRLDLAERRLPGHALEHVDGEVRAVAAVRG